MARLRQKLALAAGRAAVTLLLPGLLPAVRGSSGMAVREAWKRQARRPPRLPDCHGLLSSPSSRSADGHAVLDAALVPQVVQAARQLELRLGAHVALEYLA